MDEPHPKENVPASASADRDPVGSVWSTGPRPARPPLDRDVEVDVAVVGGGIVGLTTALELARAGRTVVLLEARRIGEGTTGRSTAKVSLLQGDRYRQITSQHGREAAATYARAQQVGFDWIEHQVGALGIDCGWERRDAVSFATTPEGAGLLLEEVEAAGAAGLPVRLHEDAGLPFPTTGALVLEDQAQLSPRRYLDALAAELDALPGAAVHESTRVTAIRGTGPHRVETERATVRAGHVVVATLSPIVDRAMVFARAEPTASYTIAVRTDRKRPRGQYLAVDEPVRSLRTVDEDGDALLLVGGEGAVVGRGPRPSEAVARLGAWAREHVGAVEVVHAWTAHDLVPLDHLPWVGPTSPVTPRVLTAAGFGKWGLTTGTAAGLMLAGHVLDDQPAPEAWRLFDPGRTAVRSWHDVAKLNAEVAGRLVADWVRPGDRPDAAGRGRRYRAGVLPEGDPDGSPATSPVRVVCTHLGGVCRWNDLDGTWDCPLHGSRFEADGTVIAGPAVRPLGRR